MFTEKMKKAGSSFSAYVFVKSVGGWSDMTQTAKLTADKKCKLLLE